MNIQIKNILILLCAMGGGFILWGCAYTSKERSPDQIKSPPALPVLEGTFQYKIDERLVYAVNQEQADFVMVCIAGGKSKDALEILDDIEHLTKGQLWGQLRYRRALVYTLLDEYKKALKPAQDASESKDPVTSRSGRKLLKVLRKYPEDNSLSDSKVLADRLEQEE